MPHMGGAMPHMGGAMPHMGSAMPGMGNPMDRQYQLQVSCRVRDARWTVMTEYICLTVHG